MQHAELTWHMEYCFSARPTIPTVKNVTTWCKRRQILEHEAGLSNAKLF